MKLTHLWFVHDPSPRSEMVDICWKQELAKVDGQMRGFNFPPGQGFETLNPAFYTEEAEARADAQARLDERDHNKAESATRRLTFRYCECGCHCCVAHAGPLSFHLFDDLKGQVWLRKNPHDKGTPYPSAGAAKDAAEAILEQVIQDMLQGKPSSV